MTTHNIDGIGEVSEDTIKAALAIYIKGEPEKYVFQAGDVVKTSLDSKRIIIEFRDELFPVNVETGKTYHAEKGQQAFGINSYRKIGLLSDYIK
ncbi:hypothetical protein LCGC14_2763770, partial [marine sediment metagenome]